MKVVFRPRAEDDLNAIYDYLATASGNADLAFEIVWSLREACLSLSTFPKRGKSRDDIRKDPRILVARHDHLVAYEVSDVVTILAVFHGRQDWQSSFGDG